MLKARWILGWMILGVMALGCRNGVTPHNKRRKRNPQQATTTKSVVELRHRVVGGRFGPAKSKHRSKRAAVGMQAPDFELPAYHKGKFTKVKLSDYRGKWLLICFYPGDFTFV